jgi:D-cysteine desulfhydrase family pyridoxal phosphate-dependent enzyme
VFDARPHALDRRVPLAHLPTPLERADRLGARLGMEPGALWVKRDDATGLAGGGNKARKLEYLCADALARGCDTLVTGGGRQSNHVRMTAAAANKLGLACTIVLGADEPSTPTGNVVLDYLFAPDIVWGRDPGYYAVEEAIETTCARLADEGRTPYAMPIGGASSVGALGYVLGAEELLGQLDAPPDWVIVADGSGGTHAGLLAGLPPTTGVLGVDVGTRPDLDEQVPAKAAEVAVLAELDRPAAPVLIDHDRFGAGYGVPTDGCREALDVAARTEGLILDPVYTGKALAGLVHALREGVVARDARVVFLHTGGMPALFAASYAAWIKRTP